MDSTNLALSASLETTISDGRRHDYRGLSRTGGSTPLSRANPILEDYSLAPAPQRAPTAQRIETQTARHRSMGLHRHPSHQPETHRLSGYKLHTQAIRIGKLNAAINAPSRFPRTAPGWSSSSPGHLHRMRFSVLCDEQGRQETREERELVVAMLEQGNAQRIRNDLFDFLRGLAG